ncbi:TPA: hypothetical protein U9I93_000027 [Acinetobacter baumannii]|uniref:hypothetical protein n=1 Tax=Acinetobacter baumannii TaxID=470 RepID=UPI0008107FCE|nr:hypothetical protein [Acinetobacter baumannii]MDC4413174.1 hypothetical protein [Acinetobacter baumannii]MDV7231980.1 hypothetical protein [Acinetobacter baumannii]HEN9533758.1 hypothetical protein [Acinetobacter baumannii]
MTILQNAIDSIALGIEDYEEAVHDSRRLISCTRNIFAGILLLFKHKLSELSPENSDEVLIKQKVIPSQRTGEISWVGEGHKTVDVQGIEDRFKGLGIKVDWKRLKKIQKYRNDIEHYYTTNSSSAVQQMISDSFLVIVNFISEYLNGDPRDLLGEDIFNVMKEIDEVYEQDKKLCVAKFQTLKYFHPAIPTVLTDTSCFECGSGFLNPLKDNTYAEETRYQCRSCNAEFDYEKLVNVAFENEFSLSTRDIMNGEEDISCNCPECGGYFLYQEGVCVACGYENNLICELCDDKIPPSEVEVFEGRCSYCNYKWEKIMAE